MDDMRIVCFLGDARVPDIMAHDSTRCTNMGQVHARSSVPLCRTHPTPFEQSSACTAIQQPVQQSCKIMHSFELALKFCCTGSQGEARTVHVHQRRQPSSQAFIAFIDPFLC